MNDFPEQVSTDQALELVRGVDGPVLACFLRLHGQVTSDNLYQALDAETKASVLAALTALQEDLNFDQTTVSQAVDLVRAFQTTRLEELAVRKCPPEEYPDEVVHNIVKMISRDKTPSARRAMEFLRRNNPAAAKMIDDVYFSFQDVACLSDADIQTLMKRIDMNDLSQALKGEDDEGLFDNFSRNLSKSAVANLKEDMAFRGPIYRSDVERAREKIAATVRQLADRGEIKLVWDRDEDEVVM